MKKFLTMAALCAVVLTGCTKNDDTAPLAGITLSGKSRMIKPAETLDLTVTFFPKNAADKGLTWSSSNPNVATVSNGIVTAVDEGSVVIKAVSESDPSIFAEYSIAVSLTDVLKASGAVEGVWAQGIKVYVDDQIWVEQGKTLVVEEGVTILIQDGQVGASNAPIEFFADGSLLLKGTKENPILVTVFDETKRVATNRYAGLWGGFVGGNNFSELLFTYVTVEYTGALCMANSQSVLAGLNVADKDQTAQILTNNPDGKIVVMNSTFRYANSDAMYFMGGKAIVANNIIHTIGENDNDGINMKAGVQVDIAYNLTFSVNSNGMKLSSSGQSPERHQALIRAYNNTIVNSGWRRIKNLKGGSIFLEQGALASVYNNLIVNSKLMSKTPNLENPTPNKGGCDWNSVLDYNFYASGSQTLTNPALQTIEGVTLLTAYAGYTRLDPDYFHDGRLGTPVMDGNSLIATAAGTPDPGFANFGFNTVALDRDLYDPSWDFHVTSANSPVIVGANGKAPRGNFAGNYAPYFGTVGLTIGGVEYKSPAPSARYGAFGVK
ncbi:MAG: Ig-like domain-containing protein [Rikenellaceae bacterium]|nr:Ig-like domain-containing protein [Rikenellaceae bacterium]MCL2693137.1 Ig-like domain-containing protein [Rikenellaceae bacterium]